MIGFAFPAWLLGLLLAPLLWWLHRSGPMLRRVPVASLDLWRDAAASAAHAGPRERADPAWLRRAAIAVLLSVALAGPQWTQSSPPVTVWVDDSLSMRAADAAGTRLRQGIVLAQRALRDASARDVLVRPLSDPAQAYEGLGEATVAALLERDPVREPRLPPSDALHETRAHWLVTDGADAAVNAWAVAAPVGRVLQIAGYARNTGLTRLSVRPQPADVAALAVQVRVLNGGDARETRNVELLADSTRLEARSVELEAGAATTLEFVAPAAARRIAARLSPADALPDDDAIEVGTARLEPLPVWVDERCPESVGRAVRAHPAMRVTRHQAARLFFDCGGAASTVAAPRVRLGRGTPASVDGASLLWSASAENLRRRIAGRLPDSMNGELDPPGDQDAVLLAAGTAPLIIVRGGSQRVVDSALNLDAPGFASGPWLPLLLAGLADVALDATLLDRTASEDRGDEASRVAPLDMEPLPERGDTARAAAVVAIVPLLLLALALLAWDVSALARRFVRNCTGLRSSQT